MKMQRLLILFLVITVLLSPGMVYGNGVEVIPAYITGKIDLKGYNFSDIVSSAYVYANATGNFTSQVQVKSDGTYTLTVNTPADGSGREYTIYARVNLKSGIQFDAGEKLKLQTVRGQNYSLDFSHEMATLNVEANFSNDDWTQVSPYYNSDSSNNLYAYLYIYKTGTHTFLIPANIPFKWVWGYAYPKDTEKYTSLSLDKKEFTAKPGETMKLTWSGTFPNKPVIPLGKICGTVSYGPLPEGSLTGHYLYCNSGSTYIKEDGKYELNNVRAGNSLSMQANSYFNNNSQYLQWPYSYINPDSTYGYIDLPADAEKNINLSAKPAMVKGKITITGSKSTSDVTSGLHVRAYGVYKTDTYGGYATDQGIKSTGEYSLYLTPGIWDVGCYFNSNYITFSNNSSNPAEYLNSSFLYYDYTRTSNNGGGLKLEAGQVVEGYDIKIPTGMVTIKFTSSDGALIKSPNITATMTEVQNGKTAYSCNVYGTGSSTEVKEAQATIVAPPGTYTVNTTAYVNGSYVTFSPKSVLVIEGVHTVIEINGPSLSLESPTSELYTSEDNIKVKGKATDDAGVESVTINGKSVDVTSTGNLEDPKEVSFETDVPLVNGPNKIEVVAADTVGKLAKDTRYVYKDNSKPTLSVYPADGTYTQDTSVKLTGKATDDNEITQISINGLNVDFTSSNNPNDPNEVIFSKNYDIKDGANKFTIIATDNCKRSTTVVNNITKADVDVVPPVIEPLKDITIELQTVSGSVYSLELPKVKDNIDLKPTLTNDAPEIFPLGKTIVTWKATDANGNSSKADQKVLVVDTTKPELTVPDDITVEAEGIYTFVDLGKASASDLSKTQITNNAPEGNKFPIGTTVIKWTATDASGNVTSKNQKITVVDTIKPVIEPLDDITIELQTVSGSVYSLPMPKVKDNIDLKPTLTNDAPEIFPLGKTIVTWKATDANGNSSTDVQKVLVVDTTKPELTVPDDITVEAEGIYTFVDLGKASASDLSKTEITNNAPEGIKFPIGTTVITWTATDASGNVTSKNQKITVVDTTKPVIEPLDDITIELQTVSGSVYSLPLPKVKDNIDLKPTLTNDAPEIFPLGKTVVTWKATDANGNSTTADQKVLVVDTTKPELTVPDDITVEAEGIYTFVDIGEASASDFSKTETTNNAPEGNKFPIGTTTITWTATDASGNVSYATQKVTVVGMMMFKDVLHRGNIETSYILSNGSIQINGCCTADLLSSSTNVVKTTGKSKIGLILKNQPIQPIAVPDWQALKEKTTLITKTYLPSNSNINDSSFEKSISLNGTTKIRGILLVKGDLILNGDTKLDNAAIFCTGKITFNGGVKGSGLIYSGSDLTNNGDINLSGSLLVNGKWTASGYSKISCSIPKELMDYFVK